MIFFVPARKGSERVAGKNMRLLCGVELVEWTFAAVKKAVGARGLREDVLVSSDDTDVLYSAGLYGFKEKLRPADLANGSAKMSDVLFHHAEDFKGHDVCVLFPTSPFRTSEHILAAVNEWEDRKAPDSVLMSVCRVTHRPYGLMKIAGDGSLFCNDVTAMDYYQEQGMPADYRANGAIFIIPNKLISEKQINSQLFGKHTMPFVMGQTDSLEIDSEEDFVMCEAIMAVKIKALEAGLSEPKVAVG